jgi:hypothetical protein
MKAIIVVNIRPIKISPYYARTLNPAANSKSSCKLHHFVTKFAVSSRSRRSNSVANFAITPKARTMIVKLMLCGACKTLKEARKTWAIWPYISFWRRHDAHQR